MAQARKGVLKIYHREALEMIVERGRTWSEAHDTIFRPEKLADGAVALQTAVLHNVRHGYIAGGPLDSAQAMRDAANAVTLPDGRMRRMSKNLFEAVTQQPVLGDGRLGPVVATATRTIGEAVKNELLLPPVSIMTVTRTIERRHLRYRATLGGRPGGQQDQGIVVGPIATIGGGSFSFASHVPTQDRGDVPADLLGYHERRTKVELNPLIARMDVQQGVWLDLNQTMGVSLPVINRGERRFAPVEEQVGRETSDDLWYPAEHTTWFDDVTSSFSPDVVVLGEVSLSWLEGMVYKSDLGARRIFNPRLFLRDVELRSKMLKVKRIDPNHAGIVDEIEGVDEVVTLGGRLVADDESEYKPIFVLPKQHSTSTIYVIPANRADAMGASGWRSVVLALEAQHGPAWGPTSDDQGRALSLPFERGATVTSSNPDKAANYDSFRFFSHAIEGKSHWRRGFGAEGGA